MSNSVEVSGPVYLYPSQAQKIHDLTMLNLKNRDLKDISPMELTKIYKSTFEAIGEAFNQ